MEHGLISFNQELSIKLTPAMDLRMIGQEDIASLVNEQILDNDNNCIEDDSIIPLQSSYNLKSLAIDQARRTKFK